MYSVVRAFAYGPRGRRHAAVLSVHATQGDAFRALDALLRDASAQGSAAGADCYVVDADRNPVTRPASGSGAVPDADRADPPYGSSPGAKR